MIPEVMDDAVLVDANVALYALGGPRPWREPCAQFLKDVTSGKGRGYASVEMIQEVLFHRLRRTGDRRLAALDARDVRSALITLDFNDEVLDTSLRLIEQLPGVRGRHAVNAATALVYGISKIASTDTGFDRVPGLTRVDPTAAPTRAEEAP